MHDADSRSAAAVEPLSTAVNVEMHQTKHANVALGEATAMPPVLATHRRHRFRRFPRLLRKTMSFVQTRSFVELSTASDVPGAAEMHLMQYDAVRTQRNAWRLLFGPSIRATVLFDVGMVFWMLISMAFAFGIFFVEKLCTVNDRMCADDDSVSNLNNLVDILTGFMGFLLGLYVNSSMKRFWTIRDSCAAPDG